MPIPARGATASRRASTGAQAATPAAIAAAAVDVGRDEESEDRLHRDAEKASPQVDDDGGAYHSGDGVHVPLRSGEDQAAQQPL